MSGIKIYVYYLPIHGVIFSSDDSTCVFTDVSNQHALSPIDLVSQKPNRQNQAGSQCIKYNGGCTWKVE